MALRDELVRVIEASGVPLPGELTDDTSLIRSGLIDSAALFDLALWVEAQVAVDLDLANFELAEEWDTVARVLAFIERHRRR